MSKEEFLALDSVIGNNLSNDGKIYGYYGGEKYCPYQEDDEEYVCDEYEYVYKNGTLYI